MKIISVMLVATSFSVFAQDVWDKLDKRQGALSTSTTTTSSSGKGGITSKGETKTSSVSTKCEDPKLAKNTSLPMKYVKRLFQESPTTLQVNHDPRSGTLKLSTGGLVDNCSPMLKWSLTPKTINEDQYYAIQLQLIDGNDCSEVNGKRICSYLMSKVVDGKVQDVPLKLEPSIGGLEQCLKETGVVTANGIDEKALVTTKSIASFSGVNNSGEVVLESVGKELSNTKPVYGGFVHEEGCSKYEMIAEASVSVLSASEEERLYLLQQKEKIRKCGDYEKIADFLEKHQQFEDELAPILESLIVPSAKKSIAAIIKGKYTDEDLKMVELFDRYVAQPKIKLARELYADLQNAESDLEKKKIQEQLNKVIATLTAYQKSPFVTSALVEKLEAKGEFEASQSAHGLKASLYVHSKLGKGAGKFNLDTASEKLDELKETYANGLQSKKDKYLAVTGQNEDSKAEFYAEMANDLREDVQRRTENFQMSMGVEAACVSHPQDMQAQQRCMASFGQTCDRHCKQNGGRYCYGAFVFNKQRCIQDGQYALQDLAEDLQHFNTADQERASEYDKQSDEWYKLEQQGRRYVAAQNGEKYVERDNRRQYRDNDRDQRNQYQQNSMMPGYNQNMFMQQNPYSSFQSGSHDSQNFGAFAPGNNFGGGNSGYNGNMYGSFGNNQFNYGGNQYNNFGGNSFGFQGGFNLGGQGMGYNQNQMYGHGQNNQFGRSPTGYPNNFGSFGGAQGPNNMGYWNNPNQAYSNYNMNGYNSGMFGAFGPR